MAPPVAPSGSNPLAPLARDTNSFALQTSNLFADMADKFHLPLVADWARHNVMLTFASCLGLMAITVFTVFALGYGALTSKAPVVTQASTAAATVPADDPLAPGERWYTIDRGDSLSEIAEENGTTVEELRKRNAVLLRRWQDYCLANAKIKPEACVDVVILKLRLIIPAAANRPQ